MLNKRCLLQLETRPKTFRKISHSQTDDPAGNTCLINLFLTELFWWPSELHNQCSLEIIKLKGTTTTNYRKQKTKRWVFIFRIDLMQFCYAIKHILFILLELLLSSGNIEYTRMNHLWYSNNKQLLKCVLITSVTYLLFL